MFEGGISFNKSSDKALRYIALFGTPIYVGYNMLVLFGIVGSTSYSGPTICLTISSLWLALGLYHYFVPIRSRFDMLWRLIFYQAMALATVMFITGFNEPFASSISLLFLGANIYFGRKALLLSVGSVIAAAAIDAALRYDNNPTIVIQNALGVMAITILGVFMIGVIVAQETRRKDLIKSQALERLQYDRIVTIINNLSDAVFSTDEKGRILMYNAACLNLLDTNDSLKGRSVNELFHLTDANQTTINLFELLHDSTKTTRREDIRHTYADGEEVRLELTFAPIRSNYSRHSKGQSQAGFILIVRDITKQKSLEEERDEFISVVSHELRTPITIVEGTLSNIQFMMQQPTLPTPETTSSAVDTAHEQVLYLARMVNDLSTLSRAERGVADEGETIDVQELLQTLHTEYNDDAAAKKLHLNLDLGPKLGSVHVSRLYLEELLQNFITNAIKYTDTGTVTIKAQQKKGIITFSIKDSGIGISRSDQQKIFNKFYRSEDYRIRETSGTGLGLYVSAKLSHKLNTHIEVTSRLNHGSTFCFTLPQTNK